jgi:hypothetical protein
MINSTLAYLRAVRTPVLLAFSGTTGTASINLPGPGGQAGDGFPLPYGGTLIGAQLWDGATLRGDSTAVPFVMGDRMSVYCQNVGGHFTVKVRLNGASTNLQIPDVPLNSTLFVVIDIRTQLR